MDNIANEENINTEKIINLIKNIWNKYINYGIKSCLGVHFKW